jgi:hypothetical protein
MNIGGLIQPAARRRIVSCVEKRLLVRCFSTRFTGTPGSPIKRNRAKDGVPIAGHKPIEQIAEGLDQWKAQEEQEDPPALETRQESHKGIESAGNLPVRMDQEGGVRTTCPIALPQGLLGLVALIGNHPNRGGISVSFQSFEAHLGCDTEAALAVIDQKTGLRGSVG